MNNLFDGIVGAVVWYLIGFGWAYGDDDYPETSANGVMGTAQSTMPNQRDFIQF